MRPNRALYFLLLILFSSFLFRSYAHPMPNSVILLDIKTNQVNAELQLPLNELELAFGNDVNYNSDHLIERLGPQLNAYLLKHIHTVSAEGKAWTVDILSMSVIPVESSQSGPYKELKVLLTLTPPTGATTRKFSLNYDVIMHQVVTHYALVSVRQDWDNGLSPEHPQEIGVISLDIPSGKIFPFQINIAEGSLWKGFKNMLTLGINHIKEGTDHLLFLLTLLLPATLLVSKKKWSHFGGVKYSLKHIVKIVTAFTVGHSITLLIGAFGLVHFPAQPIEVLIALSILVSAIHAFRPIFPGKEMYIAAGFGLIHGMAFAQTLVNLDLDAGRMALSILGFNLGIELMQLFIIAITIPWLIILSRNNQYTVLRITGSLIAAVASIAWMAERITGKANIIASSVQSAAEYSKWLIVLLAIIAAASYFKRSERRPI
jgi:hypothetical protein